MTDILVISGHALLGADLEELPVQITIEDGRVVEIEETKKPDEHWICPCFFNAHTHLGDTIALDIPATGSLSDLVAPPHGLKHRLLAAASHAELVRAMKASIGMMLNSGTGGFADFREGGADGVLALKEASSETACRSVIFGRNGGELTADGLGISSVKEGGDIEGQVARARMLGKRLAFHAGEKDSLDIDEAIGYDPDFLVHCTHATDAQLRRCADADVPIVVCPRSNWILGVSSSRSHPPIQRMLDLGCTVLLGTDNAMFVQPDMFREMAFTSLIYRIPPHEVLKMAIAGSKLLSKPFFIEEGSYARFFCIDPLRENLMYSHDLIATIVKRVNPHAIERNVLN
jgi:cytosine/adenosine deaminase-related metal-dependent hydrolase